jgi:uncharacterized coiled-coil DUF342 family protein
LEVFETERQNILKYLPQQRDQQNPIKLKQTIEEMEHRYETTTLKPQEEKKLLAEIKKIKDSLPYAERLLQIKPLMNALYEQRKAIYEKLNVLKPKIESKDAEIESVRKELEEAKEHRDDIKQ